MEQPFIRKTFFLNPERDELILTWLAGQKNQSEAVRDVLWEYLQDHPVRPGPVNAPPATIDPEAIYQAVDRVLAERLDLALIRQVVEAAVSHVLTSLPLTAAPPPTGDDETDQFLADLDDHLVVG